VKDEEQKFWDVDFICDEMIDELQSDPRHNLSIGESTDSSGVEENLFDSFNYFVLINEYMFKY